MPRVKAMLKAGPLDGAAIGEAIEAEAAEAEVGVEGGCLRRLRLRRHLPRQLLLLRRVVMSGTRRSSLSCSCMAAAPPPSSSPGIREGAGDRPATAAEAYHVGVLPW